jgi:hypothetical protein
MTVGLLRSILYIERKKSGGLAHRLAEVIMHYQGHFRNAIVSRVDHDFFHDHIYINEKALINFRVMYGICESSWNKLGLTGNAGMISGVSPRIGE